MAWPQVFWSAVGIGAVTLWTAAFAVRTKRRRNARDRARQTADLADANGWESAETREHFGETCQGIPASLLGQGLLAEVIAANRDFAREHRMLQQSTSLGNRPQALETFRLGVRDRNHTVLNPFEFEMWRLCRRALNLWDLAALLPVEAELEGTQRHDLQLIYVLTHLPRLLAERAVFLDRIPLESELAQRWDVQRSGSSRSSSTMPSIPPPM